MFIISTFWSASNHWIKSSVMIIIMKMTSLSTIISTVEKCVYSSQLETWTFVQHLRKYTFTDKNSDTFIWLNLSSQFTCIRVYDNSHNLFYENINRYLPFTYNPMTNVNDLKWHENICFVETPGHGLLCLPAELLSGLVEMVVSLISLVTTALPAARIKIETWFKYDIGSSQPIWEQPPIHYLDR